MDKIEGKPFGQPANDIEKQWLLDRLKTLSAREAYQLAAMMPVSYTHLTLPTIA